MIREGVQIVDAAMQRRTQPGSAGLWTQVPGSPSTVSALAVATGGIGRGRLVERSTK